MGNSARIEWEAGNLRHRVALGDFAGAEASARRETAPRHAYLENRGLKRAACGSAAFQLPAGG